MIIIPLFALLYSFAGANEYQKAENEVLNHATINFLGSITPEKFREEFHDIQKHGADNVHSFVTEAISLGFFIFVVRNGLEEENRINHAYKIQLGQVS